MKPPKFRTKLTLLFAAAITLLLAAVSVLFYQILAYHLNNGIRDELRNRAAALRGYLRFAPEQVRLAYDPADPEEAFFIGNATRYFQVCNAATGKTLMRSDQLQAIGFEYTPEEVKELLRGSSFTTLDTDQVEVLFFNDLVRSSAGDEYLVQVGAPLTMRNTTLRQMFHIIAWLLPAGIVLAVGLGWWTAGRVSRSLELLGSAAREVSISQLHKRLPVTGVGDELDELTGTFNDMFARLEKAVGQMREFTASISHELRTPLTALRGEAEVALANARSESDYRRVLESQLEEIAKLSHMIDQMLILARAEAGEIPLRLADVDLSELAQSLGEQMETIAASGSITLCTDPGNAVHVVGDRGWLERMILNLLDNAVKFTLPGGRVHLRVSTQGTDAVLEVRDTGVGIPHEIQPHIFEWFYRGDPSRSKGTEGSGLGLSLAAWVVKAHDGTISVESRPAHGSEFRVLLPAKGPTTLNQK